MSDHFLVNEGGHFLANSTASSMTVQVGGRTILDVDSTGAIRSVDAEVRTALGYALWTYLKDVRLIQVADEDNPPPEIYCAAALQVIQALASFLSSNHQAPPSTLTPPLVSTPAPYVPRLYVRAGGPLRQIRASDDLGEEVYLRIDPDGTIVLARWLLRELARLIAAEETDR